MRARRTIPRGQGRTTRVMPDNSRLASGATSLSQSAERRPRAHALSRESLADPRPDSFRCGGAVRSASPLMSRASAHRQRNTRLGRVLRPTEAQLQACNAGLAPFSSNTPRSRVPNGVNSVAARQQTHHASPGGNRARRARDCPLLQAAGATQLSLERSAFGQSSCSTCRSSCIFQPRDNSTRATGFRGRRDGNFSRAGDGDEQVPVDGAAPATFVPPTRRRVAKGIEPGQRRRFSFQKRERANVAPQGIPTLQSCILSTRFDGCA